ncbi:hypothetical protein HZH68_002897 [Vespula germanica]|uniref:Uncharacterized protein n=1 Tax=Vespula germanica TaxID=30212 RepID=A0A834NN44_VESGE|nr:hypothetical protein HZH68_002897 [Vespula germanica]
MPIRIPKRPATPVRANRAHGEIGQAGPRQLWPHPIRAGDANPCTGGTGNAIPDPGEPSHAGPRYPGPVWHSGVGPRQSWPLRAGPRQPGSRRALPHQTGSRRSNSAGSSQPGSWNARHRRVTLPCAAERPGKSGQANLGSGILGGARPTKPRSRRARYRRITPARATKSPATSNRVAESSAPPVWDNLGPGGPGNAGPR